MKRVVIHIDRLVLNGVARTDAAAVTAALQRELRLQLGGPENAAALAALGNPERIDVGRLRLAPGRSAAELGRAVAGGVARRTLRRGT
jgi:hypothetical protein